MTQQPRFHTVTVDSVRPVNEELVEVFLDLGGTGLERAHTAPGQFIQLRMGEAVSYFAIASPPGDMPRLELLVKRGGAIADALADAEPGTRVDISAPMGRGFPVERFQGHDVLLFATGSGISAIRPVVHYLAKHREAFGRIALFFGARRPGAFAYLEEIPKWERRRIEVHRVVSRPGSDEVWNGPVGYVQDVLDKVKPPLEDTVAFVCGQKGMHEAVKSTLGARGLAEDRVLSNY